MLHNTITPTTIEYEDTVEIDPVFDEEVYDTNSEDEFDDDKLGLLTDVCNSISKPSNVGDNYLQIDGKIINLKENEYIIPRGNVHKVTTNQQQLRFNNYFYSKHKTFAHCITYKCNLYKSRKCSARIRYYPDIDTYIHVASHSDHAPPHIEKSQPQKISEERRKELFEYIKANTNIRSSQQIAENLNKKLSKEELRDHRLIITKEDVKEMKKKFYTERIECLQDLYTRQDLSCTKSQDQFVRWVQGFPHFLLIYGSNYQINILKEVTEEDQIYVDGTFDVCPKGCEQMITIHVRKKGMDAAVPVLFIFAQAKSEIFYTYLWMVIANLIVPELLQVRKLFVACDFEQAMHKALRIIFPDVEIVGCQFHLLQAVSRWIRRELPANNPLRNRELLKTFKSELKDLARTKMTEQMFNIKKEEFLATWRSVAGEKLWRYLVRNWFGDLSTNALFAPNIWALTFKSRIQDLDLTNNQAEIFHSRLNLKFASKPGLKRSVNILQELEFEITNNEIANKQKKLTTTLALPDNSINNVKKRTNPFGGLQLVNNDKSKRKKITFSNISNTDPNTPSTALATTNISKSQPIRNITLQNEPLSLPPPESSNTNQGQNSSYPNITQNTSNTSLIFDMYNPNQPKKRGRKPKSTPNQPSQSSPTPNQTSSINMTTIPALLPPLQQPLLPQYPPYPPYSFTPQFPPFIPTNNIYNQTTLNYQTNATIAPPGILR
ncbi:hypothetical protein C9374_007669 [Naegleria lovaniensis]|uniref:MULE transposase domain-containing protein n=1 Tax=Naegleria lovaniensis TaxID=51637 RepID=A0AA88KIA0_NAELO|nr:uncharacterized protein C9374_007669 [Naegleria lovaniensis]KAG2379031.1 hypothetical protein C9374_007669 [Naegleria lovaniensis]